ncbi:uncharacterized protein BCR38DRAFT_351451 [Pseudomassariella vexata]|uniref:Uncharacterized protein n=1 Tax=Pseudomassariella vexata TaxID=1141098 RepID=A0A1Y2DKE6_9PEZI|nr:uncharacterized protein BCR38DRAFT_351451 [Pseudomassariella vexata]ORY59681.1 hypothetical protein BCR38DRAFT_351451 [Pseudomassariella vexata]
MCSAAEAAQPVANLLTVIIATSPTPSAPSTELISTILDSFQKHCPILLGCSVIVIFDAYDQMAPQARLKKGQVTAELARDYQLYKTNVKELILRRFHDGKLEYVFTEIKGVAEYGSPAVASNFVDFTATQTEDKRVTFIEPSRRLGFGLAVRSALRMTETPHVWIQQHDWALVADIPIDPLLEIMTASEGDENAPVKYVCLAAVRMLSYATSAYVTNFKMLRELTSSLKRDFASKSQPGVKIPLTPLFFWHDKPHIVSTEHYLTRAFPTRLAMNRGDFIEDKVGQRARTQMKEGLWSKWACWLYYPDDGTRLCLRHLQGRTWRGTEAQLKQAAAYRYQNMRQNEALVQDEDPRSLPEDWLDTLAAE